MSGTLPPLNSLRAFAAAARHESFVLAGKELHVSAGAISRHVKLLETYLNTALFLRQTNGVSLTTVGQKYLEKTQPLLTELAEVAQAVRATAKEEVLVISTLPVFAEKWLTPRLPSFQSQYPDIRLRFDFHDGGDATLSSKTDVMIVYSDQTPTDSQATYLFGETLVPVCSPAFRKTLPSVLSPEDVLRQTRLQDTFWPDDWNIWARAMGQDFVLQPAELSFALYNGVIQSAKSGMGIAIGHTSMIPQELETGELAAIEEFATRSPASYYLATARSKRENHNLAAFRSWVIAGSKAMLKVSGGH